MENANKHPHTKIIMFKSAVLIVFANLALFSRVLAGPGYLAAPPPVIPAPAPPPPPPPPPPMMAPAAVGYHAIPPPPMVGYRAMPPPPPVPPVGVPPPLPAMPPPMPPMGGPGGLIVTGPGHGMIQGATTNGALIRGPSGAIDVGPQAAGNIVF